MKDLLRRIFNIQKFELPPIGPRAFGQVVYFVNEIRHYRNGKLIEVFRRKR